MWAEPLNAITREIGRRSVLVTVHAGDGTAVAHVICDHGGPSRCGVFGEMRIIDGTGAPRQAARAFVLLVREALRYADSIGITHVATETPPRMRAYAARMSGLTANGSLFAGDLAAVRSHHLRVTDAGGNELPLPSDRADA